MRANIKSFNLNGFRIKKKKEITKIRCPPKNYKFQIYLEMDLVTRKKQKSINCLNKKHG
jgi:hypothetical protein